MPLEPLDRIGHKNQGDNKNPSSRKSGAYVLIAVILVATITTIFLTTTSKTTTETTQVGSVPEETPKSNSSTAGIERTLEEIHKADSTLSPDQIQAEVEARNIFASIHREQEKLVEECGCFTSNWDSLGITIPDTSKCTYAIKSACDICGTYYKITAKGKKEEWGIFEMTHKKDFRRID